MLRVMGVVLAAVLALPVTAQSFDEIVARAREAARTDRNAESADLFRQAIETHPSRRSEVLREYADQLTYSDRARDAVPLFREVVATATGDERARARRGLALALSWSGQLEEALDEYSSLIRDSPRDVDALLNLARVLSWLDRHAESERAYRAVLLVDANNVEAKRNLGRVASWRGRQREARELLTSYLDADGSNADALFLLGQAEHWLGRPDRAAAALRRIANANRDVTLLRDEVARAQTDEARFDARASTQSDDLQILRSQLRYLRRFEDGLSQAGVSLERLDYEPGNDRDVVVTRPGLVGRKRFNDAFEVNAMLHLDRIEARDGSDDVVTFDTWATYFPDDFLRFDVSIGRSVPDNILSLERAITATTFTVSSDLRPTERSNMSVRIGHGVFSDGNRSAYGSAEYERRVLRVPPLRLGARVSAIGFDERLGNGYFDPERFVAPALTARLAGRLREGVWYGVYGAGGWEFVANDDDKPQYAVNANISWQVTRRLQIEARVDRFSSRQATSSGFARSSVEAGVRFTPIE